MRAEEILDQAASLRPEGPALFCGGRSLSYSEVRERVARLAGALDSLGVRGGDRIAILHRNCHRFFETYFAALHLGGVLVPLNP